MNRLLSFASLAALAVAAPVLGQETEKAEYPSPNAIVDAAPASEWVKIAPSDLLVMDLVNDAEGNPRRVIIQLLPAPFSQGWIRNIRKLAAARWWDGTSINRVQDNYVVQWGDAGYDNPESGELEQKALPEGLEVMEESDYEALLSELPRKGPSAMDLLRACKKEGGCSISDLSPEAQAMVKRIQQSAMFNDPYAYGTRFRSGWPLSFQRKTQSISPIHCYGAVGVGRNLSPDTGSGAELYTVIGHAPRHLDRNIALVGRVIEGIEHLSSLPRGKGQLGFYEDASKRVPIKSIQLGDALAEDASPAFEYLDTEGAVFAKYADARANRRDPFFIKPAGGADICNIPVPVRRVTG